MHSIIKLLTLILVMVLNISGTIFAENSFDLENWNLPIQKPDYLTKQFTLDIEKNIYIFTNFNKTAIEINELENKALKLVQLVTQKRLNMQEIVKAIAEPYKILISKEQNGSHLNWYYGNIQLYFGVTSVYLIEFRLDTSIEGFSWEGLKIGTSIDDLIKQENITKINDSGKNDWRDNILYKNINSQDGNCFYSNKTKGYRVFIVENKIRSIYLFNKN